MARRNPKKIPPISGQVVPVDTLDAGTRMSGGWLLVHGLPLATPGIAAAVFAVLIALAHAKWGGDPVWTPLMTLLFLLVGGLITFFCWMSAGPRLLLRVLMVVTGALATGNLVLGLIVGLGVIWPAYTICALVVWVLWVVWRGTKYAGATPTSDGAGNPLAEAIRQAKVQFRDAKADERGVVRAKVETLPGGTLAGARELLPALSADARAVPGGVSLAGDPDVDGLGTVEIATRDNLKGGVPWPGVTGIDGLVGSLPTDAFPIGEYQTGPCTVQLVGDVRADRRAHDIQHIKIGGTTGSGKSTGARILLSSLLVKRRLNVIGLDISKGLQTFGPFAHGMTWVITDEAEARQFLYRFKKVIKGRTDHLAGEELMRWSLASSLNLLVVWVEESKEFRKFSSLYADLVADARSAGILFVSSTQRWNHRQASTDTRSNHGAAIMFGVTEYDDAEQILPKEALAAIGKNLQLWGASRPGYCYATGMGIPAARWSSMLRIYDPADEQLIEAVQAGAAYRDPMDPVTAQLFGELYQRRTVYTRSAGGRGALQAVTSPAGTAPAEQPRTPYPAAGPVPAMRPAPARTPAPQISDDEQEMIEMAETESAEERAAMHEALAASRRYHLGEDAQASDFADVDPDQVISGVIIDADTDGDQEERDAELPRPTAEEAQAIWDRALDDWYREGRRTVQTADLVELLTNVQRSRRFLYRQRDRWTEMGCIVARPDADGWDLIASPMETARR
ncbi:hypothetical protein Ppa06_64640 [Planomonospora parontospora subsp. parontospora]|uniref:FtsK domain-containing protein n=2 Tax=Planomonospora parontospora TaxID=58119 RepID=A0AA37BN66_9ACTN|nr:hypothetical protein [Planomonospora parontospora]GGK94278.1 hypothetical protein GCM10010126_62100 [Planomonospora parontospora]GII12666.1 hypothetical protein Ppa06_64640 [Planomonospora parontospora subsp. parontospora]